MLRFAVLGALLVSTGSAAEPVLSGAAVPASRRLLGADRWEETFSLVHAAEELRLSTGGLLWGSEAVYQDGRKLVPGREYRLDLSTGALRLAAPAPSGAVVLVSYTAPLFLTPNGSSPKGLTPGDASLTGRLKSVLAEGAAPGAVAAQDPAEAAARLREELLSGLRLTQHADQLTGGGADSGSVSYFKADPINPQTAGAGREEFNSNLDLRPSGSSRLRLLNAFARESLFTEDYEQHERQRVQFEQTLGKSTASLLWERRRSDGRGLANALDALSLTPSAGTRWRRDTSRSRTPCTAAERQRASFRCASAWAAPSRPGRGSSSAARSSRATPWSPA